MHLSRDISFFESDAHNNGIQSFINYLNIEKELKDCKRLFIIYYYYYKILILRSIKL